MRGGPGALTWADHRVPARTTCFARTAHCGSLPPKSRTTYASVSISKGS